MKTWLWMATLLPLVGGCLTADPSKWQGQIPQAAPPAVPAAPKAPPVTVDQVSPANAHQKVQALLDEIDREGRE